MNQIFDKKTRIQLYLQDKYNVIFEKYKKGNIAHCMWEMYMISLIEGDTTRA